LDDIELNDVLWGLGEAEMSSKSVELVREGDFLAEVEVELRYDAGDWSPACSIDDALRLEGARKALKIGDVASASKFGRVFELRPVLPPSAAAE